MTFADGRYSNDIRKVIMELLSLDVSMTKVNDVIKIVLAGLAKKGVTKLPFAGAKPHIIPESLILAQMQVGEAMLESERSIGNCLHDDGTTKYCRHYQNFQVTTSSGKTLLFGLSKISNDDAASTLKYFANINDM